MSKQLVYLFELDSVRKSADEIKSGQRKLYDTIIAEGQCVVLTFNQLTDSKAFLSSVMHQKNESLMCYYMDLFKAGALKISRFNSPVDKVIIRTPAQYIMNSLEKAIKNVSNSTFIFSSLPIARNNTQALQTVLDAFKYCDLSLLSDIPGVDQADHSYIQLYVKWMLDLSLLDLGNQESVYLECKQSNYWKLPNFVDFLIKAENPFSSSENRKEEFQKAREIIKTVNKNFKGDLFARSDWLDNIDLIEDCSSATRELAKEMANMCYNFSTESSIDGISSLYCTDKDAFISEFVKRLNARVDAFEVPKSSSEIKLEDFPDWEHAAHITSEAGNIIKKTKPKFVIGSSTWRKICWKGQLRKLLGACVCYILFLLINFLTGLLELVGDIGNVDITLLENVEAILKSIWDSIIPFLISVPIVSWIGSIISERLSVPDITAILRTVNEVFVDGFKLFCSSKLLRWIKLLFKGDKL